jgi:hypothetical protein
MRTTMDVYSLVMPALTREAARTWLPVAVVRRRQRPQIRDLELPARRRACSLPPHATVATRSARARLNREAEGAIRIPHGTRSPRGAATARGADPQPAGQPERLRAL